VIFNSTKLEEVNCSRGLSATTVLSTCWLHRGKTNCITDITLNLKI